jgi:hypothetical protein
LLLEANVQLRQMRTQRIHNGGRQDCYAILTALGVSNNEFTALDHDIFDPKAQRLHEPQAAAIEQIRE